MSAAFPWSAMVVGKSSPARLQRVLWFRAPGLRTGGLLRGF
jgi:hypothetical protein